MKEVEAKLGSMYKNKKEAQVVVLIGKGSQRQSITRHVKLDKGIWVGRNPDEQTEPLRVAADRRVFEAQLTVREVNDVLGKLREIAEGKLKEVPDDFFVKLLKGGVAAAIASEESNLCIAENYLKDAEKDKRDVERDYPLYVQFNF